MTVTRLYPGDRHYNASLRECISVLVEGNTNRELGVGKRNVPPVPRELKRFVLHGATDWPEVMADLKPIIESARMDGAVVKRIQLRISRLDRLPAGAPESAFYVARQGIGYVHDLSLGQ